MGRPPPPAGSGFHPARARLYRLPRSSGRLPPGAVTGAAARASDLGSLVLVRVSGFAGVAPAIAAPMNAPGPGISARGAAPLCALLRPGLDAVPGSCHLGIHRCPSCRCSKLRLGSGWRDLEGRAIGAAVGCGKNPGHCRPSHYGYGGASRSAIPWSGRGCSFAERASGVLGVDLHGRRHPFCAGSARAGSQSARGASPAASAPS